MKRFIPGLAFELVITMDITTLASYLTSGKQNITAFAIITIIIAFAETVRAAQHPGKFQIYHV